LVVGAAVGSIVLRVLATTPSGAHFDAEAALGASRTGIGWFDAINSDLLEAINVEVIAGLAALCVALLLHRFSVSLLISGTVVAGSSATTFLVKQIHSGTFPSGHATFALALAFLIVVAAPRTSSIFVIGLAAAWSSAVGLASLVAGGHRASDVVGGYLVAFAWAAGASPFLRRADLERDRAAPAREHRAAPGPTLSALTAAAGFVALAFVVSEVALLSATGTSAPAAVSAAGIAALGSGLVLGFARRRAARPTALLPPAALAVALALAAVVCAGCAGGHAPQSAGTHFRYVSTHGSDAAPGTSSRPFRTVQKAFDRARPGDTIVIRAGTYTRAAVLTRSGTSTEPIVIRGAPGAMPVLTHRLKIAADHVRLRDLVLRGPRPAQNGDVLLYVSHARDVLVAHNRILRAAMSGIFVGDGSTDVRIVGNLIAYNGTHPRLDHGVYLGDLDKGLIADNVIEHNATYGIQLYPKAEDVLVTQNTIVDNGRSGVIIGGEETTSNRNRVVNNIIAYNGEDGVRTYWGGPTGSGNQVQNNLVYGNRHAGVVGPGLATSGTLALPPGFVDRARGDYRLRASSPAIERALLRYTTSTDYAGRRRPPSRLPSLGAFELAPG